MTKVGRPEKSRLLKRLIRERVMVLEQFEHGVVGNLLFHPPVWYCLCVL